MNAPSQRTRQLMLSLADRMSGGTAPPAGPAGSIGKPLSPRQMLGQKYAALDRPAPQPQYDSGVRRGHAFTQGPLAGFVGDSRRRRRQS